jgi:hypothetical protein
MTKKVPILSAAPHHSITSTVLSDQSKVSSHVLLFLASCSLLSSLPLALIRFVSRDFLFLRRAPGVTRESPLLTQHLELEE